jgi:DUF218 domain
VINIKPSAFYKMSKFVPAPSSRKLWGILIRKERWGLSWRGRVAIVLAVLLVGWLLVMNIHPFLAVTHRVDTKVLVVEGWVDPFVIKAAVKEFKTGHYERVFTTGGPVVGTGGYTRDSNTDASVAAGRLKNAGIPGKFVQRVPSHVWNRNRTYYSAVALRNWLRENNMQVHGFNILTEDAHARRTWLLFREAFGKDIRVGIISIPDPDYNATHWWCYSEGVREVLGEAVAYIYAKFFFWPSHE